MNAVARLCLLLLSLVPAVTAGPAAASDAARPEACQHLPPLREAGARAALVIGNGGYSAAIGRLPNPTNDARAVTQVLRDLGFRVFLAADATAGTIAKCATSMLGGGAPLDVALLYYSGHGIQVDDVNYLVGVDASSAADLAGFVPVQHLVESMQKQAAATLVFLDACRDNPLQAGGREGLSVSTGRSLPRGLAPSPKPDAAPAQARGLLVAYATSPNSVAADGTGNLSPFTQAFVEFVGKPGFSVQRVMSAVTNSVGEATAWAQTPWTRSSLTTDLELNGDLTHEEAVALSENWARRSSELLERGRRSEAIVAAMKGLPAAHSGDKAFEPALRALARAFHARDVVLPVEGNVFPVVISPDRRRTVVRYNDGTGKHPVELWDSARGVKIATLTPDAGYPGHSPSLRMSRSGRIVAAPLRGGRILLWETETGSQRAAIDPVKNAQFPDSVQVTALDISEDDRHVLVGDSTSKVLTIWTTNGAQLSTIRDTGSASYARNRRFFEKFDTVSIKAAFAGNDVCFGFSRVSNRNWDASYLLFGRTVSSFDRIVIDHERTGMAHLDNLSCSRDARIYGAVYRNRADQYVFLSWNAETRASAVSQAVKKDYGTTSVEPQGIRIAIGFGNNAPLLFPVEGRRPGTELPEPGARFARLFSASGDVIATQDLLATGEVWNGEAMSAGALVEAAAASLAPSDRAEIDGGRVRIGLSGN